MGTLVQILSKDSKKLYFFLKKEGKKLNFLPFPNDITFPAVISERKKAKRGKTVIKASILNFVSTFISYVDNKARPSENELKMNPEAFGFFGGVLFKSPEAATCALRFVRECIHQCQKILVLPAWSNKRELRKQLGILLKSEQKVIWPSETTTERRSVLINAELKRLDDCECNKIIKLTKLDLLVQISAFSF
jgi:hypothetical protein